MVLAPPDLLTAVHARLRGSARTHVRGDYHQLTFEGMSTTLRVNFRCANAAVAQDLQGEVLDFTAAFEAAYSRFLPGSIIGQINAAAGEHWVDIDPESEALFSLCHEMYVLTQGVFDPATLPLLRLWDWKAQPPRIPDAGAIAAARELCGWHQVQRRPGGIFLSRRGMGLDLGGIGKEYAADRVLDMARQRGLSDILVDFGHDVRAVGHSPGKDAWYIGLQDPRQPQECWTALAVTDHAVSSSGDYFRCFTHAGKRYGHILDPRTGQPVQNGCLAVSVIAPTCTLAGILSTAAFILGPEEGVELIQRCDHAEGCITMESSRHQTRGFAAYVVA